MRRGPEVVALIGQRVGAAFHRGRSGGLLVGPRGTVGNARCQGWLSCMGAAAMDLEFSHGVGKIWCVCGNMGDVRCQPVVDFVMLQSHREKESKGGQFSCGDSAREKGM